MLINLTTAYEGDDTYYPVLQAETLRCNKSRSLFQATQWGAELGFDPSRV